jgi:hypothetical protein
LNIYWREHWRICEPTNSAIDETLTTRSTVYGLCLSADTQPFPLPLTCRRYPLPTFSWPTFSFTQHTFSPNGMYCVSRPRRRRHAVGYSLSCGWLHVALLLSFKGRMGATSVLPQYPLTVRSDERQTRVGGWGARFAHQPLVGVGVACANTYRNSKRSSVSAMRSFGRRLLCNTHRS